MEQRTSKQVFHTKMKMGWKKKTKRDVLNTTSVTLGKSDNYKPIVSLLVAYEKNLLFGLKPDNIQLIKFGHTTAAHSKSALF